MRVWPPQYSSRDKSELQCFAADLRQMFALPLAAMPLPPTYHFPKKDSPSPQTSHLLAASNATYGREQRYRRPRVALPAAASRQPGMGIGKTSDRDRERKRAAKTHGCVWRHAEFMNVVMSSLGQTLRHQAASCTRFLPSTR